MSEGFVWPDTRLPARLSWADDDDAGRMGIASEFTKSGWRVDGIRMGEREESVGMMEGTDGAGRR